MNLEVLLADRLSAAFASVAGRPVDPAVRASQHADFQSNAVLALARQLGRAPREVASQVAAAADLAGVATVEVSGPGFLNLTVDDELLAELITSAPSVTDKPQRIVIDYSGPNVAKEMHVGNVRSTVIGDALARILERQGHDVIRVNHLGDWGTQFGMLIEHLIDIGGEDAEVSLADLTAFYRSARVKFDGDDAFRTQARLRVVALQGGDELSRRLWRRLVAQSETAFTTTYGQLGVTLKPGDFVGESFYQSRIAGVLDELTAKGLLVESGGALCAFPAGFTGRDGEPVPLIVRKSDGGFGYAATDLAALRYRTRELGADRLLYVVGAPQRDHFQMVFAVAEAAGWLTDEVTAEHVGFGSILGADGKMLKTRSGDSPKLSDLLGEALARSSAPAIAIGAIKYTDLAGDRHGDYVFDMNRMLAKTGNTGPYLQYAYARIRSIQEKTSDGPGTIVLAEPAERNLALALLAVESAVAAAARHLEPHRLAVALHELAATFSVFYEKCRVLVDEPAVRASRLALVQSAATTLAAGLDMLGIEVLSTEM